MADFPSIQVPALFVGGYFAISHAFQTATPHLATVYILDPFSKTPSEIKTGLGLPSNCVITVTSILPSFSLNVDYWMILPGLRLWSADNTLHPISRNLYATGQFGPEDWFRFIYYALSFSWASTSPSIETAVQHIRNFAEKDPQLADLVSLKETNLQLNELLTLAQRKDL
jgi:hypothetical protein